MSSVNTDRWLAQARELQEKVRAAHERALKAASGKEKRADTALRDARRKLQDAMRAAQASGFTEREIARVTGRSSTAVHFSVTRKAPEGPDPASQRRAAKIRKRLGRKA